MGPSRGIICRLDTPKPHRCAPGRAGRCKHPSPQHPSAQASSAAWPSGRVLHPYSHWRPSTAGGKRPALCWDAAPGRCHAGRRALGRIRHPSLPRLSTPRAKVTDRRVLEVVKAVVGQDEPASLPRLHPSSWGQRGAGWGQPRHSVAGARGTWRLRQSWSPRRHTQTSTGRRGASRARQPGRRRAQQQQAAHTTPGRARAAAESRRMRMEAEGGGGAPSRDRCARSHPKH